MLKRFWGAVIGLSVLVQPVWADSLDLNLHDKAMRVIYSKGLANRGLEGEVGVLFDEDDNYLANVGVKVAGENWSDSGTFDITMGVRAVYADMTNIDAAAVGIGGGVRFSPIHRLGIGGHIYYAPSILSFSDAESYSETGLRVDYQLLAQGFVYIGYRKVEIELENSVEVDLDDEGHVGMKILF